jgi:hypothetical protein
VPSIGVIGGFWQFPGKCRDAIVDLGNTQPRLKTGDDAGCYSLDYLDRIRSVGYL